MTPIFSVRDAVFRYPETTALNGLSVDFARGERVALLGANGSGKSTLLHLLDALYFAQAGELLFNGRRLDESALADVPFAFEFRRSVGFVFQNPEAQLFNPTVFDEVAFGPLQLRWPKPEIVKKVRATLDQLALGDLSDRAPHRLSGGEKKRVALASVLVLDPEVLLLDEPTAGLDPQSQNQMIDFLFANEGAKTVITATHELAIVEDIADRCCVLEEGRLAADGPPAQILRDVELLRRARLLYAHRHRHGDAVHSHPLLPGALSHTHPPVGQ